MKSFSTSLHSRTPEVTDAIVNHLMGRRYHTYCSQGRYIYLPATEKFDHSVLIINGMAPPTTSPATRFAVGRLS